MIQLLITADTRQFSQKAGESGRDCLAARHEDPLPARRDAQPIAHSDDEFHGIARVGSDVLSRDVGTELLKSVAFFIEDQADLLLLLLCAEPLGSEEQPQLEGHVEARKSVSVELPRRTEH
ncbi:MAG TPA: hypothetical protein VMJ70_04145 [Candidatus Sulfotelmatobacter sp.]|nr:hypothetical protein [Candidatus Sulfotelmatobacter sp.]